MSPKVHNQRQSHRRARIACDSCFRRKVSLKLKFQIPRNEIRQKSNDFQIKCYRDTLPCEWCCSQGLQCTFDRDHRNNRVPSAGKHVYVYSIFHRYLKYNQGP